MPLRPLPSSASSAIRPLTHPPPESSSETAVAGRTADKEKVLRTHSRGTFPFLLQSRIPT